MPKGTGQIFSPTGSHRNPQDGVGSRSKSLIPAPARSFTCNRFIINGEACGRGNCPFGGSLSGNPFLPKVSSSWSATGEHRNQPVSPP
jgi:hypothetical protein